jgi:hypothetical protein
VFRRNWNRARHRLTCTFTMHTPTLRALGIGAFIVLSLAPALYGQDTFRGILEPELTTPDSFTLIVCKRLAADDPVGSRLRGASFGCWASWYTHTGQLRIALRLSEPSGAESPQLFVDSNQDGVFADNERFTFSKLRHRYARAEVRFAVPTPQGSAFSRFPVVLQIPKEKLTPPLPPTNADERYLFQSFFLFATARVAIDGKTYFFRYGVSPDATEVTPGGNIQAIDRGEIDDDLLSPLRASPRGDVPVFRLGTRHVQTDRVDLATRSVLVRSVDQTAYKRLELRRGLIVPDFAFRDLDNQIRRLSDFRNRHVLLYFWQRGCTPCEDQLSHVRAAGVRFGSNKLAIIGFVIDHVTPVDALRTLLLPSGPFDTHALPASASRLVEQWFGIDPTPTSILLDPKGRIVSFNQQYDEGRHPLHGAALLRTLASVLPRR